MSMIRACVVVLAATLAAHAAAPPRSWMSQWVQDLASDDAAVWRAAVDRLWKAGTRAEPVLRQAAKSTDPDVVLRARLVLERFEWGIAPDTPAVVLAAIEKYRTGDEAGRKASVAEMVKLGRNGYVALRKVLAREGDAGMRRYITGVLQQQGPALLRELLASGDRLGALELLETRAAVGEEGMRDLAAFWVLTGQTASRARALTREAAGGNRSAAVRLAYLHRAAGDLEAARRAAEKAEDSTLLAGVAEELQDFKTVARLDPPYLRSNPAALAVLLYHAGDRAGCDEAFQRVPSSQEWRRASVYFATDRPQEAIRILQHAGSWISVCRLMALQGRWTEALALSAEGPNANVDVRHLLQLEQALVAQQAGKPDRAKRLFEQATTDMDRATGLDVLLARAVRVGTRLGRRKEALNAVGLALDRTNVVSMYWLPEEFSAGKDDAMAFWWRYLGRKQPGTPASTRLARLCGWFDQKKADRDFDDLIAGVEAETDWPVTDQNRWAAAAAAACLVVGKTKKAEEILQAFARKQNTAAAHQALADFYFARNRYADAESAYARAATANPGDALLLYLRGVALRKQGKTEQGQALVERARLMPLAQEATRYTLATGLRKLGLEEEAAQEWQLLVRTSAFRSVYATNAASVLANRAARRNRPLEAASIFRRVYLDLALHGGAFTDETAYLRVPAWAHAYQARGLAAAGKFDEAVFESKRALAHLPEQGDLVIDLTSALDRAGRKASADHLFDDVFARHERECVAAPKSAVRHNQTAWLAARCRRQMGRGIRHAHAATKLAPDSPAYLDTLAELYFQRGDRARAVATIERAVEKTPGQAYYAGQLRRMKAGDPNAPLPRP